MSDTPRTLQELLASRAEENTAWIRFLDQQGNVAGMVTYADLYTDALRGSRRLLASGLKPGSDIVVASFADHERHIRLFWSCCFAGITICPLPPLHPDPSRRAAFLAHLQGLLHGPLVITDDVTVADGIKAAAPELRTMSWETLSAFDTAGDSNDPASTFYPRSGSSDDIVCLMLTSGSTGNSKAVPLRHSNILSAVRGKAKCHGTTSSSVFLNWIAFDHVACVTEVHIHAMVANASQYHVAPSAVIQRPRALIEWCSRYQITYSFSPNFLMAQLCRDVAASPYEPGALDLSTLVAFITGGEAVPVNTAIAFADLLESFGARRNVIRAGFGMSETAAGCVYNTRPVVRDENASAEKYLSLGRCASGITLRVVSPHTGDVCGPVEPGQLQMKGPTVFREYYNNVDATTGSFTADGWFITGDSAMVDSSGDLHLVGRDKDQININGVKHPSVDVEHFVEDSGIDGVMRSFVFVCPMRLADSDTDTYAVFYQHRIHVEDELSEIDVATIHEANRAIRKCCIVMCSQAPHVVLPLPRKSFSKTALGKVSRSALMTAYLAGQHTALEHRLLPLSNGSTTKVGPHDAVEEAVFEAVIDLTRVQRSDITRDSNLFALGMTSMHLVQLKNRLQCELRIEDIPIIAMLRHSELGELCDCLRELQANVGSQPEAQRYIPLVPLRPQGRKPPIFLFHPGFGEILVFVNLVHAMPKDYPLYALRARGFDPNEDVFESMEEMVGVYLAAVEARQPTGPYYLAGYSFGGVIAFEITKALEAKGERVAWLGIFDLPPIIRPRMYELTWPEMLLYLCMFIALVDPPNFEATRSQLYAAFPELSGLSTEPTNGEQILDWLLPRTDQERLRELQMSTSELKTWMHVAHSLSVLGRTYELSPLIGDTEVTVFCAAPLPSMGTREEHMSERMMKWKDYCANLELVDVAGEHYTMLSEENVQSFVQVLCSAVDRASERNKAAPNLQKLDAEGVPTVDFSLAQTVRGERRN